MHKGKIIQVSGPIVDVEFEEGQLPHIREVLTVSLGSETRTMEVARHLGDHMARCIMLSQSEGIAREMEVSAPGNGLKVPVGDATIGRMFNVLGEVIDGGEPIPDDVEKWEIHRKPPTFAEQNVEVDVLETGIKVIDLLEPYARGGKIGLFGGAGVG
ncbi:MAG: F0F1 ATP synthase subunit beta, partial [Lachnospiraceae bacterium]|nr:F0F1 ATP synthase subunit beta [Lachnospiraceae bacterium]